MVKWLVTAKQNQDVVVVADGRSEVARKQIRELLTNLVGDDFLELWVVYNMETTLHKDVRNPKRKTAWSGANMEVLFVIKQKKSRKQRSLVARDMFTNCGESTNFSRSYTGVPYRNLVEIPRLTADAKQKITGVSAVGDIQRLRVTKEVNEKGHPLLWSEWKPVTLYSTLYRDFQVADVVDLTPGSGAACLAALYSSIPYIGLCSSQGHQKWLQDLLQRMFVAMVMIRKVSAEPDLVKNITTYLERAATEAKLMLPRDGSAVGDSFTGDDDSDVEDLN